MALPYVTPERFRVQGFGNDLSNIEDVELASVLDRATALVHQFCNVPTQPQLHDFRGGSIVDENHDWRTGQIRIYPWHQPVKAITSFRIYATNTVYLDIPPNQMFINNTGKYIEVVALSLTPVGFWAASGLISLVMPVARSSYTYGWTFPVVGEKLYDTDAQVYRAQNQFWVGGSATVYKNGSVVSSGFTVDEYEGTVTFSPSLTANDVVTVDYTHTLPSAIPEATGIIASSILNERAVTARGLGNLQSVRVEEVELDRGRRLQPLPGSSVPDEAQILLSPFKFWGVAGSATSQR